MWSCKEDPIQKGDDDIKSKTSIVWNNNEWTSESGIDPANNLNSLDYIGQQHNNAVNFIANHINSLSYNIIDELQLQNELIPLIISAEQSIGNTDADSTIINSYFNYFSEMENNYYTTAYTYSYDSISARLKLDLLEDIYLYTENDSLNVILDTIKSFESIVIQSINYSIAEKEDFLMYSSILRYSLVYWYDVEIGLRIDWNNAGYGGLETNLVRAASKVKSVSYFDAMRRKYNKLESNVSNSFVSYVAYIGDAITEGVAWMIRKIKNGMNSLEDFFEDLF